MSVTPKVGLAALVGGVGALLAVSSLSGGASAGIAKRGNECPNGALCLYSSDQGQGQMVKIKRLGISNKVYEQMNNEASSVVNNRAYRAILYGGRNGKGRQLCVPTGTGFQFLDEPYNFDNRASSTRNSSTQSFCPKT